MFFGFSGVLTATCLGLRPSYALDLPAFLDLITIWTLFGLRLDHDDRVDRDVSPATVHDAPAVAAQYEQLQEPLRGGRPPQAAAAHE